MTLFNQKPGVMMNPKIIPFKHGYFSIFRKPILLLIHLFCLAIISYGQWTSAHPGMEWNCYTTGRTTGHVIDLYVTNTANQPETLEIGPFYIPGPGQPYVTDGPMVISLEAGAEQTIPINGYCFVDDILPAPAGTPLDVNEWIALDEVTIYDPQTDFTRIPGFKPVDVSAYAVIPKVPGYEFPLAYSLKNIENHPQSAAPLALAALDHLQQACSDLQAEGKLITPFRPDQVKEEQALIQHSLWMYSEALEGRAFDPQKLEGRIIREFEDALAQPFDQMAASTQQDIRQGIGQFQQAFMEVGSEAMVINPGEAWYTHKFCVCEKMTYAIIAYKITGGKIGKKGSVNVSDNFSRLTLKKKITGMGLKKGDRVLVFVTTPALTCHCSDGSDTCPPMNVWNVRTSNTVKALKIKEVPHEDISDKEGELESEIADKIDKEEKTESQSISGSKYGSSVFEVKSMKKPYAFPYNIKVQRDCVGKECGGVDGYKQCVSTVSLTFK
jgi:hypothetical protein